MLAETRFVFGKIATEASPHCGEIFPIFGRFGAKQLSEEMNVPFLGALPLKQEIAQSGDAGKPFANDIVGLAKEFDTIVTLLTTNLHIHK